MITESLLSQIDKGRSGINHGYSMGMPKLESIVDGVIANTYSLIFSPSGTGEYCRLYEKSDRLSQTEIGEGWDANTEVIVETKESTTP